MAGLGLNPELGQLGSDQISDTNPYTGHWKAIQIVTDTVFATLTDASRTDHGVITGLTFVAGELIFGRFTAITLTSGKIIAYNDYTPEMG